MTESLQVNDSLLGAGKYPLTEGERVVPSSTTYHTAPGVVRTELYGAKELQGAVNEVATGVTNKTKTPAYNEAASLAIYIAD
jgi:hypothetical protein